MAKKSDNKEIKPSSANADEKLLTEARERFALALEAESDNRNEGLDDRRFKAGEQWPAQIKKQREDESRPCLTINKLPQFIKQVTNDERQNRPAIKVLPVDSGADPETAKILSGLIRHIEINSDADVAYDTAAEDAVTSGWGYFRVITEYADDLSFDQDIKIRRIRNPFTVYLDPAHQYPDGSDAKWGFISEELDKEEYKAQYPDADEKDWEAAGDGDGGRLWYSDKKIRIAEYFRIVTEEKQIALLADGRTIARDELEQLSPEALSALQVVKTRKAEVKKVQWYKLIGNKVLDKREWPGKWIPIIKVTGDEQDIDGKLLLSGMIRNAKDPSRMYNYWRTAATELVALAPKAPFVGAEGQFEGHEHKWAAANVKSFPYLEYKPKSLNGQPIPPPQRQPFAGTPVGVIQEAMTAADDIKAVTGIYDASLGARSNETSGRAIIARQREGDTSTFNYIDNLTRAIRHCGRILVDLIPKIYDAKRIVRILGEDGSEKQVQIVPGSKEWPDYEALDNIYDISVGKYDVTVTVGPSYTTKRLEAADSMMQFVQAIPNAAPAVMDLVAKNMDWPGADDIAERLKKMLPPGLDEEADAEKEPAQPNPAEQMALQKMQMEIEKLRAQMDSQHLDNAKKELELSTMTGQLGQVVQQAVAQTLMQMLGPPPQQQMMTQPEPGPQPGF